MKAVIFWLGAVFFISIYPEKRALSLFEGADKVFHSLLYAITCALFYVELRKPLRIKLLPLLAISIVLASAYGLLMEILQGIIGTRQFSFHDAVANMLGAVAAAVIIATMRRRK